MLWCIFSRGFYRHTDMLNCVEAWLLWRYKKHMGNSVNQPSFYNTCNVFRFIVLLKIGIDTQNPILQHFYIHFILKNLGARVYSLCLPGLPSCKFENFYSMLILFQTSSQLSYWKILNLPSSNLCLSKVAVETKLYSLTRTSSIIFNMTSEGNELVYCKANTWSFLLNLPSDHITLSQTCSRLFQNSTSLLKYVCEMWNLKRLVLKNKYQILLFKFTKWFILNNRKFTVRNNIQIISLRSIIVIEYQRYFLIILFSKL